MSVDPIAENCMSEEERDRRTKEARRFIRWNEKDAFASDQQLRRVQPPLFKAPVSDQITLLPTDFSLLSLRTNFAEIIASRKSNRVYTQKSISLLQLSFLLWCAQGVKSIRGKQYATIRTVPSGGARHPFECYPLVLRVEGLVPGYYHYLPEHHQLELLTPIDPDQSSVLDEINASVCGQSWVCKASVILYYSLLPYRGEWRYGFNAHRVMMMDAGHTMQNVYLACSAMELGACAIAAVDDAVCDRMFSLDGIEEYMLCCVPVGTVDEKDVQNEQSFYAFLREEEPFYHQE